MSPLFDIITFFPDLYPGHLGCSILGNALEKGLWHLNVHHIRDFTENKHRNVDDKPTGGGSGMVLRPDVTATAFEHCLKGDKNGLDKDREIIYASPAGERFDQNMAQKWAQSSGKIFLCGRFEGVDQRVLEHYNVTEVSLGDFILCGGDAAVQTMLEATIRLLPDVVGKPSSILHESFKNDLLEHAHYTTPQNWEGVTPPEILYSGHHQKIDAWRHENAKQRTKERRPDLWKRYCHYNSA